MLISPQPPPSFAEQHIASESAGQPPPTGAQILDARSVFCALHPVCREQISPRGRFLAQPPVCPSADPNLGHLLSFFANKLCIVCVFCFLRTFGRERRDSGYEEDFFEVRLDLLLAGCWTTNATAMMSKQNERGDFRGWVTMTFVQSGLGKQTAPFRYLQTSWSFAGLKCATHQAADWVDAGRPVGNINWWHFMN